MVCVQKIKNAIHDNLLAVLEALKHGSISEIFFYVFVAIYPILPAYFVLLNLRVSSMVALLMFFFLLISKHLRNFKGKGRHMLAAMIIIAMVATSFFVNGIVFSTQFVTALLSYIVVPLSVICFVDSREKLERCISILLTTGFVLCLLSTTELFGFNIFSLIETVDLGAIGSGTKPRFGIMRVESSFGQAIAFAIYISFLICLTFYRLFSFQNKDQKKAMLYFGLLFVFHVYLVLTVSRFPLLIIMIVDVLAFFFLNKRMKLVSISAVLAIVIFTLILSWALGSSLITSIIENIIGIFTGQDTGDNAGNPFSYRLDLFSNYFLIIGDNYLFGLGPQANTTYWIPGTYDGFFFIYSSFDNGYLLLAIYYGLVGLIGWLLFYAALLYLGTASINRGPFEKRLGYMAIGLVVITLLNMLSVANLDEVRTFIIAVSLLLAARHYDYFATCSRHKLTV